MSRDFVLCDIIILFDISMILEGHMTCLYKHQNILIWLLTLIMSSSIFSSSCDLRSCDSSCDFFHTLLTIYTCSSWVLLFVFFPYLLQLF